MLRSLLVMLCWVGCVWEVPNVLGIEAIAATKPITVSIQMNMTEHSAALLNWQHAHNIKSVWGLSVKRRLDSEFIRPEQQLESNFGIEVDG
jgi:hypothetical protein